MALALAAGGTFGSLGFVPVRQVQAADLVAVSAQNADHIVISQIYAGGTDNPDKGDSTYTHDYIELYNPTDYPVSLAGWSVQYVPYTYTGGSDWNVVELGLATGKETIPPHGYYLIQGNHGDYAFGNASKPVDNADAIADAQFPHLNKDGGVVALIQDSAIPLNGASPAGSAVDFVGYGGGGKKTPGAFEGAFAPDGSYKKAIVRKGLNPSDGSAAPPTALSSTGFGSGYDTDNNANDFVQLNDGMFAPRNSSVREPGILGIADSELNAVYLADDNSVDPSANTFKIRLTAGQLRDDVLIDGTDYAISGWPAGTFSTTAVGSTLDNAITVSVTGAAYDKLNHDVPLQVRINSSALADPGSYPDSGAIAGIKLASQIPQAKGEAVAGSEKIVFSDRTAIARDTLAIALSQNVHLRTDTDSNPLTQGIDYIVNGLPPGLSIEANADAASNRILFAVSNPDAVSVLDDAALSVIIRGHAVQEEGTKDSDPIDGLSLERYRTAVDASEARKNAAIAQLAADNAFFDDPAIKAYKYSTQALAHDAYTFFRGTGGQYWSDLGTSKLPVPSELSAYSNLFTYIQGDAHIQNVGIYNDSQGNAIFALNDFDAAKTGVFYEDLLRFVSSLYLIRYDADSGKIANMTDEEIRVVSQSFLDTYARTLVDVSGNSAETSKQIMKNDVQPYTKAVFEEAAKKNYAEARAKQVTKWLSDIVSKTDKFREPTNTESAEVTEHWNSYLQSIRAFYPELGESEFESYFKAKKVRVRMNQGLGSQGSMRYNVQIEGPTNAESDDFILDVKEQLRDASLTVQAYRAMSIEPNRALGFLRGAEKSYLVQEISPYKGDYADKTFSGASDFMQYVQDSAIAYAYAHARSDEDSAIGGLTGSFDDTFAAEIAPRWPLLSKLIVNSAEDYAKQTYADYDALKADMIAGKLVDVATLSSLSLSGLKLNADFSGGTLTYTADAPADLVSTDVSAQAKDAKAGINPADLGTKTLNTGLNKLEVRVTAQDGHTTKTYVVKVTKAAAPGGNPSDGGSGNTGNTGNTGNSGGTSNPGSPATPPSSSPVASTAGGKIAQNGALIEIPAGAVGSNITVNVQKMANPSALMFNTNESLFGDVYEITKNSTGNFNKAVTITLPFYSNTPVPAGYQLGIYWYDEAEKNWVALERQRIDAANGTVSGQVNHFTKFAILSVKTAADEQPVDTPTPAVSFKDMQGHWAQPSVARLVELGAIAGYPDNSFKPNRSVTRAEFATMLVKALKLEGSGQNYSDTTSHWAREAIAAASGLGIVNGYADRSFGPDDTLTREQMASMLVRAAGLTASGTPVSFSDAAQVSSWSLPSLQAAVSSGLMNGYTDGTIKPQGLTTRAEAATVLSRLPALNP